MPDKKSLPSCTCRARNFTEETQKSYDDQALPRKLVQAIRARAILGAWRCRKGELRRRRVYDIELFVSEGVHLEK